MRRKKYSLVDSELVFLSIKCVRLLWSIWSVWWTNQYMNLSSILVNLFVNWWRSYDGTLIRRIYRLMFKLNWYTLMKLFFCWTLTQQLCMMMETSFISFYMSMSIRWWLPWEARAFAFICSTSSYDSRQSDQHCTRACCLPPCFFSRNLFACLLTMPMPQCSFFFSFLDVINMHVYLLVSTAWTLTVQSIWTNLPSSSSPHTHAATTIIIIQPHNIIRSTTSFSHLLTTTTATYW